jgi:translation initiation factor 2B subunit (eIF-2B alpha/beta/delta family)
MDKEFGADDHKFVMQKARELDASGLEKKRQEALIEHAQKQVEQKQEKKKEKQGKKAAKKAHLAKVVLVFDKAVIRTLQSAKLQDQLDAYELAGAPLPRKADTKLVAKKIEALLAAIDSYNAGKWVPRPISPDGGSND